MTSGLLTVRQALSVATTGLLAAVLGLGPPAQAAMPENRDFLEGLRDLKLPDAPPVPHKAPAQKKPSGAGAHRSAVGPHAAPSKAVTAAAPAVKHGALSGAAPDTSVNVPVVSAPVVPAPAADAQVQRLRAALAATTAALKQSQAREASAGAVQATVAGLNQQLTGLQEQLMHAEKERDDARREATSGVALATQATADVTQSRDEARAGLREALSDVARLKVDLAAREDALDKLEASQTAMADVQKALDQQKQAVADLTAKTATLTRERDALKAAADKKAEPVPVPAADVPAAAVVRRAPDTAAEKEAYVSGWQIAGMVRRARLIQTTLGLATDQDSFMAGLQDGVTGTPSLPEKQLTGLAAGYITVLETRERARFADSMGRLEKMTASADLVKRNGSVLFLRKKAGKTAAKEGMVIRGSLKERVMDGRVITDRRDITFDYGVTLPAIVRDAIALGQVGSVMEVVCLGADIYPPGTMPADVYPWSLMQYTITTTGVVSAAGAEPRGPVRAKKG